MRKIVVLCFVFCLPLCSVGQTKEVLNVGILLDYFDTNKIDLFDELKNEIKAVVGEDAEVKFDDENILVADLDVKKAQENYNTIITKDVDIILAFGLVNNEVIARVKSHPIPTILFGVVSNDLIKIKEGQTTSEINNFSFIITSKSYASDLLTLHQLSNYNKVGIIIEDGVVDGVDVEGFMDTVAQDLDVDYKVIPFKSLDDILSNIDGIDAAYLVGGFYLQESEIKTLANEFIKRKIPSFTNNTITDLDNGLMATNQAKQNLNQFFRRVALSVEDVVSGKNLKDIPIYLEYDNELTINYNTAQLVELPIKNSLLATTNFVGNFNKVIYDKKYGLVEVLHNIIQDNLGLQVEKANINLAGKDVQSAKSEYLPNLSASASAAYVDPGLAEVANGQSPEFSTSGNIGLSQLVYSEAVSANVSIQKSLEQAQIQNYTSEELNTVLEGANTYLNCLILKANLQIVSQNLELTKTNLQIAKQNFEAGQSGKSDVLRFQSELAQGSQLLIEAINSLKQSFFELNKVLNNPIDQKIDVEDLELQVELFERYNYSKWSRFLDNPKLRKKLIDFLVEFALENSPELKSLDYNLEATDRSLKLYSGGRFVPTLALQGQYIHELSRSGKGVGYPTGFPVIPDGYYNVGASLTIPLIDQNKQNINKQIAIIQKDQIEINEQDLKLQIASNINNAILDLINQIANIELSKVSERTAEEGLELTQASYNSGAVNIVQLLDAQNNYLEAQLANISANYNYLFSALQLERSLGYFFLLHTVEENEEVIRRFEEFALRN
ncbi:MAG: hypothetical protein BM564_12515 [Bacteroidetes bacterium MedPE-SWsnd-G2]|nr:MAG: hypothetical protein BM564_12515 [Bacteroidetes bacterium MedPE-SWsnd-G2]